MSSLSDRRRGDCGDEDDQGSDATTVVDGSVAEAVVDMGAAYWSNFICSKILRCCAKNSSFSSSRFLPRPLVAVVLLAVLAKGRGWRVWWFLLLLLLLLRSHEYGGADDAAALLLRERPLPLPLDWPSKRGCCGFIPSIDADATDDSSSTRAHAYGFGKG